MISHSKRFLFIHIYKVAGSSVRAALAPYCPREPQPLRFVKKHVNRVAGREVLRSIFNPLPSHSLAINYRDFLKPETFETYFKFAFVRNPYDWQVSHYEYIRQTPGHPQHAHHLKLSFADYIRWRCDGNHETQKSFVTDDTGAMIVDFIGKFENLNRDFNTVAARLGLSCRLPHVNASKRKPLQDYYTEETQALVAETFREDFRQFGYSTEISTCFPASARRA